MLIDLITFPINLLKALGTILSSSKLTLCCVIPIAISIASFCACVTLFFLYRDTIGHAIVSSQSEWLSSLIAWGFFLLNIFISGFISIIFALGLGAVYIDSFIEELFRRNEFPILRTDGFVSAVRVTLKSVVESIKRLVVIFFLSILLVVCGLIPLLTLPALVLSAFIVGTGIVDAPLVLLGLPFIERWRVCMRHKSWCLMVGSVISFASLIPCGGILILPILLVVTVEKMRHWVQDGSLKVVTTLPS